MNIQNKKSVAFLPFIFAIILIAGIIIGIKLSRNGSNDRLLIYPRADKVNSVLDMIEDTYVDSISRNSLEETAINSYSGFYYLKHFSLIFLHLPWASLHRAACRP